MLSIKYSHTLDNYHKNDYNHKYDYICTIVLKLETLLSQMKKSRKQKTKRGDRAKKPAKPKKITTTKEKTS